VNSLIEFSLVRCAIIVHSSGLFALLTKHTSRCDNIVDFCTIDAGRPVDDTRKYTTRGVARIIISVEVRAKAMRYEVWGGRCTPYREGVWEGLCPLQGKINSFCETYAIWCIITHLTGSIAHALPLWLPPCVTQLVVAMFSKLYTFEARQVSAVQAYVLDGRTS